MVWCRCEMCRKWCKMTTYLWENTKQCKWLSSGFSLHLIWLVAWCWWSNTENMLHIVTRDLFFLLFSCFSHNKSPANLLFSYQRFFVFPLVVLVDVVRVGTGCASPAARLDPTRNTLQLELSSDPAAITASPPHRVWFEYWNLGPFVQRGFLKAREETAELVVWPANLLANVMSRFSCVGDVGTFKTCESCRSCLSSRKQVSCTGGFRSF